MNFCPFCNVPQADTWMCTQCAQPIIDALAFVAPSEAPRAPRNASEGKGIQTLPWEAPKQSWAGFEDELLITLARLDKHGKQLAYGRTSETPLPFNEQASDAAHNIRRTLASWVITLCDPNHYPEDTLTGMAGWLIQNIHLIRHSDYAQDAANEIVTAVNDVLTAIGPHPEKPKPATPDLSVLLEEAADKWLTKQEILAGLPDVSDARFRQWVNRARIIPRDWRGRKPLYRVGDVLNLINRKAAA